MLTFFIKSTVIWTVLFLFYTVFLSQEKSPARNRIFLWISLIAGIVIPLIPSPFSVFNSGQIVTTIPASVQATREIATESGNTTNVAVSGFPLGWEAIVFYLWLIGSGIRLLVLIKNISHLYFLKKYSEQKQRAQSTYFIHAKTSTPFSFGKIIFLPAENYTEKDLTFILEHEHLHFLYRHWIDNSVLALLQILF